MIRNIILPALLAATIFSTIGQASPLENDRSLLSRNNKNKLKCSNAPNVVAGYLPKPNDILLPPTLPPSGSNQEFTKYLWCTPNTKTYTNFAYGTVPAPPTPNITAALTKAVLAVQNLLQTHNNIDAALGAAGNPSYWSLRPANTNVEIWVQSSVGTMTYGILEAALRGLSVAARTYNGGQLPMVFRINDGGWGEVGVGYVGLLDGDGRCYYQMAAGGTRGCQEVVNGGVKGFD